MGKPRKRVTPSSKHTAAGQAAGYFFQPERALKWLSDAPSGAMIGIETDDDITLAINGKVAAREQDKHSLKAKHPFDDHSRDLWKSLLIWLDGAQAGEFDPTTCKLYLATNTNVGECFLRSLLACKGRQRKIKALVGQLLSDTFPECIVEYVERFKKHDAGLVHKVLAAVELIDASDASFGAKLREHVASALHLPDDLDNDVILDGLLGWIHHVTLENWRAEKPAWITRKAFDKQYHRIHRQLRYYTKCGLPAHLLNVSQSERRRQLSKLFVRQLTLINASQGEVFTAIDDYCRCRIEKIRLANDGDLTSDDWLAFDDVLQRHWGVISEREKRSTQARPAAEVGYSIYSTAIQFQAALAQEFPQPYMTTGTFHRLANELTIGWHPDFDSLCRDKS